MMSGDTFIYLLLVLAWTTANNAQESQSEVCVSYANKNTTLRADSAANQQLNLLCAGEKELKTLRDGEFIAVMGRRDTGKTLIVESLAGIQQKQAHKLFPKNEDNNQDLVGLYNRDGTNLTYLDFPDFVDAREAQYDIPNAQIIKTVLNGGKKVKFVVVEKYTTFTQNEITDKNDFLTVLKHVSTLIKGNISKFKESIVLIASHVDAAVQKSDIIKKVEEFLNKAQDSSSTTKEQKEIMKALMKKDDKSNQPIGFVRFSDDKSKIIASQDENKELETTINTFKFTDIQPGDFSYTASVKSLGKIPMWLDEMTTAIKANISATYQSIKKHYENRQKHLGDDAEGEFASAYAYLFDVKMQEIKDSRTLEELESTLRRIEYTLGSEDGSRILAEIELRTKYMSFLRDLSNDQTTAANTLLTDFSSGAGELLDFLYLSQRWYIFKSTLHKHLISAEVQNNRRNNNTKDQIAFVDEQLRTNSSEFIIKGTKVYNFLRDNFPTFSRFWETGAKMSHAQLKEYRTILYDDLNEEHSPETLIVNPSNLTATSTEKPESNAGNSIAPQYIGMWTGLLVLIHVLCANSFVR